MRHGALTLAAAALAAASLAVTAAAPPPRVLRVAQDVSWPRADGGSVAFLTDVETSAESCERVAAWTPGSGAPTWFRLRDQCRRYGDVETASDLVFTGGRLVWSDFAQADRKGCVDLYTATLRDRRPVPVAGAPCDSKWRYFDFGGRGSTVAFVTFVGGPGPTVRRRVELWRVDGTQAVRLGPLPDRSRMLGAGGARIAVTYPPRRLVLVGAADGRPGATATLGDTAIGAWFDRATLVVRTRSALELRDAASARLLRTLPLPYRAHVGDVRGGLAVYVVAWKDGATIHVLRLSDGRDRVYRRVRSQALVFNPTGSFLNAVDVAVALGPAGLFFAYNVGDDRSPGRIGFAPASALARLLS